MRCRSPWRAHCRARLRAATSSQPYGFNNVITAYLPIGNSSYHGLAIDLNKRFANNLLFKAGYTWSHAIDDSTAEVFSTVLTPRRPQDFFNRDAEKGSLPCSTGASASSSPGFTRRHGSRTATLSCGTRSAATPFPEPTSAESPQWATVQSGVDSNMNGDAAADRAIINTDGADGTSSDVTALCKGGPCSHVCGRRRPKRADGRPMSPSIPTHRFIKAQVGTYANAGKNLLPTKGINNFDVSVAKNFSLQGARRR